jgi:hypothetical protein
LNSARAGSLEGVSKRRERRRERNAPASSEGVESEETEPEDIERRKAEPVITSGEGAPTDNRPEAQAPGGTVPVPEAPVVFAAEEEPPRPVEPVRAAPTTPEPEVAPVTTSEVSAAAGNDLDALGRMLERSLSGGTEGPLPTVLPPGISATPEDILGVPTQHTAMQELQQQVTDNESDEDPQKHVTLSGAGTGAAPMEAFEEKAQMAKEVLRATSSQPSHAGVPVSGHTSVPVSGHASGPASGGDPAAQEESERPEERDEDVRFSEDLTISVKRRRKLFGR